jgi:hypothetical protein
MTVGRRRIMIVHNDCSTAQYAEQAIPLAHFMHATLSYNESSCQLGPTSTEMIERYTPTRLR